MSNPPTREKEPESALLRKIELLENELIFLELHLGTARNYSRD